LKGKDAGNHKHKVRKEKGGGAFFRMPGGVKKVPNPFRTNGSPPLGRKKIEDDFPSVGIRAGWGRQKETVVSGNGGGCVERAGVDTGRSMRFCVF